MTEQPRTFRVIQLGPPRGPRGTQSNEAVADMDGLVTHHPGGNRSIHMRDGRIAGAEGQQSIYRGGDRSYAYIDGEFQEVIDKSTDRYGSLKPDQVLIVKDFILEDPSPPVGASARAIAVPSPTAGYVSRVQATGGMVEIMDRAGGDVIARVRHLNPVSVREGDRVAYGQSLGTQHRQGLGANAGVHVHIEIDTVHRRDFEDYIGDLISGRLPVQAGLREGIQARAVMSDDTFRLGQSHERIRDLQLVMASEGYRAVDNRPLDQDGVYRPAMQGALLDFQRAHGLPQTGNIDPATLQMAPAPRARAVDVMDHFDRDHPVDHVATPPTAPGHPEHLDHRPGLPPRPAPAINQHSPTHARAGQHPDRADLETQAADRQVAQGPFDDPYLDRAFAALMAGDSDELDRIAAEFTHSPEGQRMIQQGDELYAQQQLREQQQLQEQQAQTRQGPSLSR